MKYVLSAVALILAAPAAAQTAPAPQHQDHQQHQASQAGHAQHQPGQHGQHQAGQHGQHQAGHQGHAMADGCCADRNGNGRMDCCENMAQARGEDCAGHDEHQATPAQPSPQND